MSDYCEIIVKCQLDKDWSGWLEGLTIKYNEKGETVISGRLRDQTAFYGLLTKVRDICPFLISVKYTANESKKDNNDTYNNS